MTEPQRPAPMTGDQKLTAIIVVALLFAMTSCSIVSMETDHRAAVIVKECGP